MVRETRSQKKKVMRSQKPVRESLTHRTVSEYLEFLMAEGRIGNKLDWLELTRPETLKVVDMSQVQELWGTVTVEINHVKVFI